MADKKEAKVRVRAGVLPEVREIRRPDFTKKAADIEKAEAERVLNQGDAASDEAQAAAVAQSLEAQEEAGADGEQLDESAISDVARWYVAHTYSGYENKVREGLIKTVENRHLENQIFEVTVPMQDVYELKNGAKKLTQKKLFPGYVLVRMIMNDETWYVVRNTRGVTGFVGPGSKPVPLSEAEMKNLGIRSADTKATAWLSSRAYGRIPWASFPNSIIPSRSQPSAWSSSEERHRSKSALQSFARRTEQRPETAGKFEEGNCLRLNHLDKTGIILPDCCRVAVICGE